MTIAIVTDSTSDLTPEMCRNYGVTSVPLYVLFDGRMYRDGIDITAAELIEGIQAGKKIPSTSQPSPVEFADAFRRALEEADQVISIHLSGQLSGTVGSARLAAQDFGDRVTVIDSKSVSMGLGMRAIRASEMAAEGKSVPEIVSALALVAGQAEIRFTVDTLDFLRLNGRIGGASAFLGGLLNIRPILAVRNGRVDAAKRVRGNKKALQDIVDYTRNYAGQHGGARVAFMATLGSEAALAELREALKDVPLDDLGTHQLGAVIATHGGPGTLGVTLEPIRV